MYIVGRLRAIRAGDERSPMYLRGILFCEIKIFPGIQPVLVKSGYRFHRQKKKTEYKIHKFKILKSQWQILDAKQNVKNPP